MIHSWWFRVWAVVALVSLITSTPGMLKILQKWWVLECGSGEEKLSLWRRLLACTVVLLVYPVRALLWPLTFPIEVIVYYREFRAEEESNNES